MIVRAIFDLISAYVMIKVVNRLELSCTLK